LVFVIVREEDVAGEVVMAAMAVAKLLG